MNTEYLKIDHMRGIYELPEDISLSYAFIMLSQLLKGGFLGFLPLGFLRLRSFYWDWCPSAESEFVKSNEIS